ncbi:MAG: biotin synthase BioB, partial [Candidatus Omnitrophica bacterium]|nr:biotin synthase BioB [Candidatus Omnitrophota bacterium]
ALYPANSLFLQGYLNAKGVSNTRTLQMIKDAGFSIKSEVDLDELLGRQESQQDAITNGSKALLKTIKELRPSIQ